MRSDWWCVADTTPIQERKTTMGEMKPYQKRFVIEYRELDERIRKLGDMLRRWNAGTLDFTPSCPHELLSRQLNHMNEYRLILEERAKIEDIDLGTAEVDCPGDVSDGHHTFNELYRYRMLYNAAFLNTYSNPEVRMMSDGNHSVIVRNVGKSRLHHDGTEPFGGGWFIVWAELDGRLVSNHYELEHWDLFDIPEYATAPEWDGSTPEQEADALEAWLMRRWDGHVD